MIRRLTRAQLTAPEPPAEKLTARVCRLCGKGKGTFAYRQDGGSFFAHLKCLRQWMKENR